MMSNSQFPQVRLRRLRRSSALRALVRETKLSVDDLVMPLFIKAGLETKMPINSLPGQFQLSLNDLASEIAEISALEIPAVMLFGIPAHKDAGGSAALAADGIIPEAVRQIKRLAPELIVITDLCFCGYTSHGHCGVLRPDHQVNNDATLELLAKQAIIHATAGADIIAPSGMMDGAIACIRQALDQNDFADIAILSYAVKFASAFYGPFRDAAESAPGFGDRKTYQLDPANSRQGLREAELDVAEGADMLMVKPAQAYLDIIYQIKHRYPQLPLSAYQVSGEYAMIKAAAQNGWLDEKAAVLESLLSIKRAGADFIISYFAKDCAKYLRN
jgi:porphobilinogen synthase